MTAADILAVAADAATRRLRLGFLGTGWIGRHRMRGMIETGLVEAAAIVDPVVDNAAEAQALAPGALSLSSLDALLDQDLDGVVIATPSADHAEQSVRALERGIPVFCQKPLGRNAAEVRQVVEAARRADRLLGVDLSYRHASGMKAIREQIRDGALGRVHAVDLTFHNAYGPDKPWFYDPRLSGGGCVMDLGVHLVDLALWALDFPTARVIDAALLAKGRPIADRTRQVEDFAMATLRLGEGCVARLACSWHLHAGTDAVIAADFFGDAGGAGFRNVNGSFYDFEAALHRGTSSAPLASPPDAWGARAAAAWAAQLARSARFDPSAEKLVDGARLLDAIYDAALR